MVNLFKNHIWLLFIGILCVGLVLYFWLIHGWELGVVVFYLLVGFLLGLFNTSFHDDECMMPRWLLGWPIVILVKWIHTVKNRKQCKKEGHVLNKELWWFCGDHFEYHCTRCGVFLEREEINEHSNKDDVEFVTQASGLAERMLGKGNIPDIHIK